MRFNDSILMGYKPSGANPFITPEQFEGLSDEDKYYYEPDYKKYRVIKVRDYSECCECGHKEFLGWVEKEIPVGEPYRYLLTAQTVPYALYKMAIDNTRNSVNSSNVLMERVLNKPIMVDTNGRSVAEALSDPKTEIVR